MAYQILQVFPFSSELKRMGIIVRDHSTQRITLYVKGADEVMVQLTNHADWVVDEVGNMAREGLRTLLVASRTLSEDEYAVFKQR